MYYYFLYRKLGDEMNNASIIIVKQLNPGMIVAEDVYDNRGHLIISHELPISEKMIMRLKLYSIEKVRVYETNDNGKEAGNQIINKRRLKQNTESLEFQEFKRKYMKNVVEFKEIINEIVYGNSYLDQKILLKNIEDIIKDNPSKSQLFYMLRNLKEYDNSIYMHCYNVAIICKMFGIWLNKSENEIEVLTMSGLLHDIGRISILKEMENKGINDKEEELIKRHPAAGYEILKNEKVDDRIKLVALQHHERRNGSGYPNGLQSNEICEFAQIVAIADTYDKMTAKNMQIENSPFQVFDYFQKEGYDLFESRFLLPFMEKASESYLHNKVTLTNGVEGEIIMLNGQEKSRPMIRTQYGFIDLNVERNLEIEDIS